jgi:SAM-dependent methyltransferase
LRRTLLRVLRATHLIQFADRAVALHAVAKHARANAAYRAAHPDRVFPDPALVFETIGDARLKGFDYGGGVIARVIADHLLQAGLPPQPRILDWGAGAGRLLVHLPALLNAPGARYFGCDPNPRAVAHVQHALPFVDMRRSDPAPPAPFDAASFDAITGISIFTHFSQSAAKAWAGELSRLLSDEGAATVSTHGALAATRLPAEQRAAFHANRYVELGGAREGSRTYVSYFNETAGRALFEAYFADVAFHPSGPAFNQDIWVLRRPRRPAA